MVENPAHRHISGVQKGLGDTLEDRGAHPSAG